MQPRTCPHSPGCMLHYSWFAIKAEEVCRLVPPDVGSESSFWRGNCVHYLSPDRDHTWRQHLPQIFLAGVSRCQAGVRQFGRGTWTHTHTHTHTHGSGRCRQVSLAVLAGVGRCHKKLWQVLAPNMTETVGNTFWWVSRGRLSLCSQDSGPAASTPPPAPETFTCSHFETVKVRRVLSTTDEGIGRQGQSDLS